VAGAGTDPHELDGFDTAAARAVAAAEREARALGHDRVGTEHLLLGLLVTASDASRLLTDAGVTLAAAREKVSEAVGEPAGAAVGGTSPLPRTARAARALRRAGRFAHAEGSDAITSDHVLSGLLDVEGRAGQVLRGLRVEIETLHRAAQEGRARPAAPEPPSAAATSVRCPSCHVALEGNLAHQVITATPASGSGAGRDAVVFSCASCGRVLGVAAS